MPRQKELEAEELMRHALDVVQTVEPKQNLAPRERLLQRRHSVLGSGRAAHRVDVVRVHADGVDPPIAQWLSYSAPLGKTRPQARGCTSRRSAACRRASGSPPDRPSAAPPGAPFAPAGCGRSRW